MMATGHWSERATDTLLKDEIRKARDDLEKNGAVLGRYDPHDYWEKYGDRCYDIYEADMASLQTLEAEAEKRGLLTVMELEEKCEQLAEIFDPKIVRSYFCELAQKGVSGADHADCDGRAHGLVRCECTCH